jgi:hypothetical protein
MMTAMGAVAMEGEEMTAGVMTMAGAMAGAGMVALAPAAAERVTGEVAAATAPAKEVEAVALGAMVGAAVMIPAKAELLAPGIQETGHRAAMVEVAT